MNYLKIPDVALGPMLNALLDTNFFPGGSQIVIDLFTSPITPGAGDTYGTYSPYIPTFTGYSAVTKTSGNWTTPTVTSSVANSKTDNCTFTATAAPGSPVIAYGYFVHDNVSPTPNFFFAQAFDTPLVFINAGDSYSFPLSFDFANEH